MKKVTQQFWRDSTRKRTSKRKRRGSEPKEDKWALRPTEQQNAAKVHHCERWASADCHCRMTSERGPPIKFVALCPMTLLQGKVACSWSECHHNLKPRSGTDKNNPRWNADENSICNVRHGTFHLKDCPQTHTTRASTDPHAFMQFSARCRSTAGSPDRGCKTQHKRPVPSVSFD